MRNEVKKFKSVKIIAIFVAIALFAAILSGCIFNRKTLKYDSAKGAIASNKVENAQYTPDIDKYFGALNDAGTAACASLTADSEQTNSDEFAALIDKYAKIENYAGAGKYLGYDIYEIKNEIEFIVGKVPAFNQWFRMPGMREEEGYASIPYYESWAYYLEMDEETSTLSVTRVCNATRSSYFDYDNSIEVETHEDSSSFIQYEIMKTNYTQTETDEIVECFIYSVGIDHIDRFKSEYDIDYYNTNIEDYHPFEYQYLRNVKDKSMVKCHVTAAERTKKGMDIRGLHPYGARREFMVVDYDGYQNIETTSVDQKFSTDNQSFDEKFVNLDVNGDNVKILLDAIGYEGDVSSLSERELLDEISKHIVDNFELKNKWAEIYKDQASAVTTEPIYGPFYGKEILLKNVDTNVSTSNSYGEEYIRFHANAEINDISKFDTEKEYSLSMALKSRENGKLFIAATDYRKPEKCFYNGSSTDYYYRLTSDITLTSSEIAVDENGTYDIVCVLTTRENGKDKVMVDTMETSRLKDYYGLNVPDSSDNSGITRKYAVSKTGGKLVITVSSDEE